MKKILLLFVTSFAMTGCCAMFCEPTICDGDVQPDPDGGGRVVDRDGQTALYGGKCVAPDDA